MSEIKIKVNEEKRKIVKSALKNMQKDFGKASVDFYADMDGSVDVDRFSTGIVSVDLALGGGLARGDFSEVYGKPSVGKTTLMLSIIGHLQRRGLICAFIDVEQDFDPDWAKKNGVILDDLLISQPDSLEQALTIAEGLIKTGAVYFVGVDSLASLTPQDVIDRPLSKDTVGLRARKLAQFFDKNRSFVRRSKTHVMFTNQWRESPDMFVKSDSPGGWSGKHTFGIRIEVWKANKDLIMDGDEPIAIKSHITVIKNKIGAPYRKADFRVDFLSGVNYEFDLIEHAEQFGIIEKSGTWYKKDGKTLAQGENNLIALLKVEKELYNELDIEVRKLLGIFSGNVEGGIAQDAIESSE